MFFRRDLLRSYSYLALLLELGEPLHRALPTVRRTASGRALENFWGYVEARVREGETLSEALGRRKEPVGLVSLLRAGEANGNLIAALRQAAGRHQFNPDATRRHRGEATPLDESGIAVQGPLIRIAHAVIQQAILQGAAGFALHPGWPCVRGGWPPLDERVPPSVVPLEPFQAHGQEETAAAAVPPVAVRSKSSSDLARVTEMVQRYGAFPSEPPEEERASPMMGVFYRMEAGWQEVMRLPYHIAPPLTRRFLFMAEIPYWAQERSRGRMGINYQGRDYDLSVNFDPKHAPVLRAETEPR